jgi:hypothetical protein
MVPTPYNKMFMQWHLNKGCKGIAEQVREGLAKEFTPLHRRGGKTSEVVKIKEKG